MNYKNHIKSDSCYKISSNSIVEDMSYTSPVKFKLGDESYFVSNWTEYIVLLAKKLIRVYPEVDITKFNFSQTKRCIWSKDGNEFLAPKRISESLFLETNYSGTALCSMSLELIKFYKIDFNNFVLYFCNKKEQQNELLVDWQAVNNGELSLYSFSNPTKFSLFDVELTVNSWMDVVYEMCNVLIDKKYNVNTSLYFIKEMPLPYDKDHYGCKQLKNGLYIQVPYMANSILKCIVNLLKHSKIGFNECKIYFSNKNSKKLDWPEKMVKKSDTLKLSAVDAGCIREVYVNNFKRRYRVGSIIDYSRFNNFFNSEYNKDIALDQKVVEDILAETSIKIEDKIIDVRNVITDSLLVKLKKYIDDQFNNNYYMLYYKDIYLQYENELISTNVSNELILKNILIKLYPKEYVYERTYMQSNINLMDIVQEVRQCFETNDKSLSIEEIVGMFVGVSEEKVRQIIYSDNGYINVAKNTYCRIEQFKCNKNEINMALDVVNELIKTNGFALRDNVINILLQRAPAIIENNQCFGNAGICRALEILFNNNIKFKRYLFTKDGEELVFSKILINAFKEYDHITIQQLQVVAEEIGIGLSKYYLSEIFNVFIRVSEKEFVRKQSVSFDIAKIDDLLKKYTADKGYISLKDIKSYSQFPVMDYSWNDFLLISYIENYSPQFEIRTESNSINKAIGYIVRKDLNIKSFDELIEKVLRNSKINFDGADSVLNYLFEIGLIGKRRYQNIGDVLDRLNVIN